MRRVRGEGEGGSACAVWLTFCAALPLSHVSLSRPRQTQAKPGAATPVPHCSPARSLHPIHPTHPNESTSGSAPSNPAARANATASRQGSVGKAEGGGGAVGAPSAARLVPARSRRAASAGEGQGRGATGGALVPAPPPAANSATRRLVPSSSPSAARSGDRACVQGASRPRPAGAASPSRRRARWVASMCVCEGAKKGVRMWRRVRWPALLSPLTLAFLGERPCFHTAPTHLRFAPRAHTQAHPHPLTPGAAAVRGRPPGGARNTHTHVAAGGGVSPPLAPRPLPRGDDRHTRAPPLLGGRAITR